MRFYKIAALLGMFLLIAATADCQMNRDTPTLESKLPRTYDNNLIGQGQQPSTPIVISIPFNSQAVSDLYIVADPDNTTCDQISFWVILTASTAGSTGYQPVKVRILENRLGTPTAVAELTLLMPVSGGSLHETIGFVSAVSSAGSMNSNITISADPDNQLKETNERNNQLTVNAICQH